MEISTRKKKKTKALVPQELQGRKICGRPETAGQKSAQFLIVDAKDLLGILIDAFVMILLDKGIQFFRST